MDNLIAIATRKLEVARAAARDARARLAEAEAEQRKWETFFATYAELSGRSLQDMDIAPEDEHAVTSSAMPIESYQAGAASDFEAMVTSILRSSGNPLSTSDIMKSLRAMQFYVKGKNPAANLSARLSRSDRFRNVRKRWVLNESTDDNQMNVGMPSVDQSQSVTSSGPVKPEAGGGT